VKVATELGVLEVFRAVFGDPSLVIADRMVTGDIAGWDSFKNIEILLKCESHFGIQFRSKEIDSIKTIGDLIALIERKVTT
jgi:acyl carrier protein